MSHTVALADMYIHYDEHRHCNLFRVNPTYTVLVLVCIYLPLKIVPNKYTIYCNY